MNKNIDFKIEHNKGYLRWINWEDFILRKINSSNTKKINNNIVIFVTFNNSKDTIKNLDILLKKETRTDFDILIIDNHSNNHIFDEIKNFIKKHKNRNIILLQTIDNLGGAGGYALGLEYILNKNYKYVIITEDDVIPLQDNTVSEILNQNNNGKDEILIKYKDLNTTSFSLHFHGYPINLIRNSGVPDPRYFMRSDDLEWALRINNRRKKLNIKDKIINNLYYTHPVIKKVGNKFWQLYLGQRNSNFTESRWRGNISHFIITFLYLWYGFSKLLLEKDFRHLKYLLKAYFDFTFVNFGYKKNKNILEKLFKEKDSFYKEKNFFKISIKDFNKKFENYFFLAPSCSFLKNKIIFSKKIKNFFEYGVITSGFNSPIYPIFSLSKNNVSIEEVDGDKLIIYKKENKGIYRFFAIFLSFILGLFLFIFLLPIFIIRFIIGKVFKI